MSTQFICQKIELKIDRCHNCGRWYGWEGNWVRCPRCAELARLALVQRVEHLLRSIASLKGALTKMRGRKRW